MVKLSAEALSIKANDQCGSIYRRVSSVGLLTNETQLPSEKAIVCAPRPATFRMLNPHRMRWRRKPRRTLSLAVPLRRIETVNQKCCTTGEQAFWLAYERK